MTAKAALTRRRLNEARRTFVRRFALLGGRQMRNPVLGMCFALFGSVALLVACQSLASNPLTAAFSGRKMMVPFRGQHQTRAWRLYGHVRRMIIFPSQIQHVVVISMENRTVDNLFSGMSSTPWTGPGGYSTWGKALDLHDPSTAPTLTANPLSAHFDPSHAHDVGWRIESQGNWKGEHKGCTTATTCPSGATALSYVPTDETGVYQFLVKNWAFANNVLQANEGPSFVAHQYYIAAQSGGLSGSQYVPDAEAENPAPAASPLATGDYTETIDDIQGDTAGCTPTSKSVRTVNMVLTPPPQTPLPAPTLDNGTTFSPPCEDYNTILDEIVGALSNPPFYDWQYIAMDDHNIWAAPLGVQHLYTQYTGGDKSIQPFAVDPDAENFVLNISGSTSPTPNPARPFAALTYITPCVNESDHPLKASQGNDDGPAWLGWLINAVGESRYWNSTAIIVTWDDWGGWYDHDPNVPNSPGPIRPFPNSYGNREDPNEWGFRVPLIVISPYVAKRGYISNGNTSFTWRSQSAISQYIEHTFGLSSLNGDDLQQGQTDELQDMFNYGATPLPYMPIPTPSFVPGPVGSCPGGNGPSYRRPPKALKKSLRFPAVHTMPPTL